MLRVHLLRAVLMMVIVTVVAGVAYPLLVTGIGIGLFPHQAEGSLLYRHGELVGSALIGQSFTTSDGTPLPQYFQPRPSAAGAGYDPTASGASNLGPSNPLLVGFIPGVTTYRQDASVAPVNPFATVADPFCVPTDPKGNPIVVVDPPAGQRYARTSQGGYVCDPNTIPERAIAYRQLNGLPTGSSVPVDAVTASGSGLDPDISVANALDQAPRVARARGMSLAYVDALVHRSTAGRSLGFLGEPGVNVVELNLALGRSTDSGGGR
ncbi:MAG TPA: potassium-transporting ATPase subunit C [Acidimicrobiales bacterium]|nr:potassium-transporting ATPase subunit C [Acidimicrobiales bacterium]